jgi:hypothetical protein
MPDRLEELQHQRALVQEHLTWLEHEIAALTVTRLTRSPFPPRDPAILPPPSASSPPHAPAASLPLDLPDFRLEASNVQGDARRGCLLYVALAIVVIGLGLTAIYFLGYRDHPVLFVPDKSEPTLVTYPAPAPKTPAPAKPAPAPKK